MRVLWKSTPNPLHVLANYFHFRPNVSCLSLITGVRDANDLFTINIFTQEPRQWVQGTRLGSVRNEGDGLGPIYFECCCPRLQLLNEFNDCFTKRCTDERMCQFKVPFILIMWVKKFVSSHRGTYIIFQDLYFSLFLKFRRLGKALNHDKLSGWLF